MSRNLLVLLALLVVPAGCSRAEEAVKNKEDEVKSKATQAVDNKIQEEIAAKATKMAGGNVTTGAVCPRWPKNVPVYPGATIIACDDIDARDAGTGNIAAELAARQGKAANPSVEISGMLSLGIESTASADDIVAFYKKSLPQYQAATSDVSGAAMTALANKTNAADPVSTVLLMPMQKTSDGKTSSTIVVLLKKT